MLADRQRICVQVAKDGLKLFMIAHEISLSLRVTIGCILEHLAQLLGLLQLVVHPVVLINAGNL